MIELTSDVTPPTPALVPVAPVDGEQLNADWRVLTSEVSSAGSPLMIELNWPLPPGREQRGRPWTRARSLCTDATTVATTWPTALRAVQAIELGEIDPTSWPT